MFKVINSDTKNVLSFGVNVLDTRRSSVEVRNLCIPKSYWFRLQEASHLSDFSKFMLCFMVEHKEEYFLRIFFCGDP